MENTAHDPVQYPTVVIDGKPIEVKFRCGDIIRLKKEKEIELTSLGLNAMEFSAKVERMMTLLSVAVSHAVQKTPEELADLFDLAQLSEVDRALGEAIKKAFPQATAQSTPTTVQ